MPSSSMRENDLTGLALLNKKNFFRVGPRIDLVPKGVNRPLFSVMIPTFNPREDYLLLTLRSVLNQDLGPEQMQIEVLDDGSWNGVPEEVMSKLSSDRITYVKRNENTGLSHSWNLCIQRARGKLVHILHQDDLVLPGFYEAMKKIFDQEPTIGAAFCRFKFIDELGNCLNLSRQEKDEPGILPGWLERIAVRCDINCPAIVVKRSVYEDLGGFHPGLVSALDWEMWKRIAVRYPFGFVPGPLACWRQHIASTLAHHMQSFLYVRDNCKSIDISSSYLPKSISAKITRKAKEQYLIDLIYSVNVHARKSFLSKNYKDSFEIIWWSLKCNASLKAIAEVVRFGGWVAWSQMKKMIIGGNLPLKGFSRRN
jgi:glycosyltransferase involved in cell wall biosynthesis